MSQIRSLPRVCIALGLPDVPTLMAHARREAEAGEAFLEFRLDFLDDPRKGAEAIPKFLEEFPECTILATCRRHQSQVSVAIKRAREMALLPYVSDSR